MPSDLGTAEKKVWNELLGGIPPEIFRSVDGVAQFRILVECIVMARNQFARLRRDAMDRDAHRMYMQSVAHIHKLSAAYGLTPKDRQGIKVTPKVQDDVEEWMAEE